MNLYIKNQFHQFLIQYLQELLSIEIKGDKKEFKCPVCKREESALMYPNNNIKFYCGHPECNFKGDIFDLIKKIKNPKFSDEDVVSYLTHKYKIVVKDDIGDLLKLYEKNKFCLFPLEPESKNPQKGFMWTEKLYTDPVIWMDWIDRGYGIGLRLGKVSMVIAIDIDDDKTYEKLKEFLGEDTLIQTTKRGKHWLFLYEDWMSDIKHINFRPKGYDMEIRANNAYVAIAPTSANGEMRKWNDKKIQKMPKKLKEFLLGMIDKDTKNVEEEIQEAIDKGDLGEGIKGLDGCCNDTFIKIGGILRKRASIEITKYALSVFNDALDNPMDKKSISGIMRQIGKYQTYDKEELADEVLKRLEIIKEGTAFQIAGTLKKDQKDVEDVLKYLEDNKKIIALKNRKYQVIDKVEWTTDKSDMSVPVDFRVPYFGDYAHFDWGNMIIIGAPSGTGKTHIAGNIIKQLWEQKRTVHLINTEAGSKIAKITHKLGIPDEAYLMPKKPVAHAMDVEFADNAVTIVDWLQPKDGDFAAMETTYKHFHEQLKTHGGFLFVLAQIRKSNNKFFAEDLCEAFGAGVFKYLFGNNGQDSENTYFLSQKLRDSKSGQQYITIPTFFNKDSKILELRK